MRPLRILLADDSRDNRLLVQATSKKTPYIPTKSKTAPLRFEARPASTNSADDIAMPIMTATRDSRNPQDGDGYGRGVTPIIALTGSVLADALKKALDRDAMRTCQAGSRNHAASRNSQHDADTDVEPSCRAPIDKNQSASAASLARMIARPPITKSN